MLSSDVDLECHIGTNTHNLRSLHTSKSAHILLDIILIHSDRVASYCYTILQHPFIYFPHLCLSHVSCLVPHCSPSKSFLALLMFLDFTVTYWHGSNKYIFRWIDTSLKSIVMKMYEICWVWCYLCQWNSFLRSVCLPFYVHHNSRVNIPLLISLFWCFSISYFLEGPRLRSDNLGFLSHIFIAWALQWCDTELLHNESN